MLFAVISGRYALWILKNSEKVRKGIKSATEADVGNAHIAEAQEHFRTLNLSDVQIVAVI